MGKKLLVTMKKLLIFDFDGVVVDSLDVYEGTVRECLEKIGQPILRSREDFLELFDDNFYESLAGKGVNLDAFMEASVAILAEVDYGRMRPFYPLIPVLQALKTRHILAIISSSDSRDIRIAMETFRLSEFFSDILGSDAGLSKRAKFLHILEKYAASREETCYVCDTVGDIKEAKAVGIKTAAVTWGWHSKSKLAAAGPDYLIDKPEELLAF